MKKCPICEFDMMNKKITQLDYHICDNCGFLQKDEEYILDSSLEKERYLEHVYDENYHKYMVNTFLEIKPFIYGNQILDYGCGREAYLGKVLEGNGYGVVSYDKYFFDIEYKNKKYDSIILIEVIEHIYDPLRTLIDLKDILNKDGRIIIKTNLYDKLENWWYLRDSTHVSFFNKDTFTYIANKLDLKIIQLLGNLIVLQA